MPNDLQLTVRVEPTLHEAFMQAAEAAERSASDILRDFMREFVDRQQTDKEYDVWFRAEVERGLREASDPTIRRIPHEEVAAEWRLQRAEFLRRAAEQAGEG